MTDTTPLKKKIHIKLKVRPIPPALSASRGRLVADPSLFQSNDPHQWELAYRQVMNGKYAKGTRHYSQQLVGRPCPGSDPSPIYVIPRQRGGPQLQKFTSGGGVQASDVQYTLISKGFGMQDLSSFTFAPHCGRGSMLGQCGLQQVDYGRAPGGWRPHGSDC